MRHLAFVVLALGNFIVSNTAQVTGSTTPATSCGSRVSICENNDGWGIYEQGQCGGLESSSAVQLTSLHVDTLVQARYAYTEVTSAATNVAYSPQIFNYTFVVPDTSRISRFTLTSNGVTYVSQPRRKEDIELETPTRTSAGLSVRGATKFVVRLTLDPNADAVFTLSYEELLERTLSKYTTKVHLNPGQVVPDLSIRIQINEVTDVSLLELSPFTNDVYTAKETTAAVTKLEGGQAEVKYQLTITEQIELAKLFKDDSATGVNGYLTVSYDVQRYPSGGDVIVNENHFIHYFSPAVSTSIAKHAIFVLDVSGSMSGTKIQQLKDALVSILAYLDPKDSFSVMEFSSSYKIWNLDGSDDTNCNTYKATSDRISAALARARSMSAGGGTAINQSILKALQCARNTQNATELEPILLFLTDGQPTDATPGQIISNVVAANTAHTNIYSLAFGADADFEFLRALSSISGGKASVIYEGQDATSQLEDFYKTIATPLLLNINVKYDNAQVDDLTQNQFDQYFQGSELRISGRLAADFSGELTGMVTATGAGQKTMYYPIKSIVPDSKWDWHDINGFSVLERSWAFMTLAQLLENDVPLSTSTTPSTQTSTVSPAREKATALAMKYSFVSLATCLEFSADASTTVPPTPPQTTHPPATRFTSPTTVLPSTTQVYSSASPTAVISVLSATLALLTFAII